MPVRQTPTRHAAAPGIALLLVLGAVAIAFVLSVAFLVSSRTTVGIMENVANRARARAIAESGLELAIGEIVQGGSWRTDHDHGVWVADEPFDGGSFTIRGEDGADTDGDGVPDGDGDLADGSADTLTLTAIGQFGGVVHTVRSVVTPSYGGVVKLLLVVADPGALDASDEARVAQAVNWRYVVTLLDDDASAAEFDAAILDGDVVWVSRSAAASGLGAKLLGSPIGVVSESPALWRDLGAAADAVVAYGGDSVEITDNLHHITQPFSTGPLTILGASDDLVAAAGAIAGGARTLAAKPGAAAAALLAVDAGADLVGGGSAAGRRVVLPWSGSGGFDSHSLSAEGLEILRRSLEWGGMPPNGPPPLSQWRLDETSGIVAHDSGARHDGTVLGGSRWTAGQVTGGLDLDGVDDYIEVPNAPDFQVTRALSITAWVRADTWSSGDVVGVILRKGEGNPNRWQFAVADRRAALFLDDYDNYGKRGNTLLGTGRWYHLAATWDGAKVRIYVDGAADNGSGANRAAPIGVDERPVYLGGRGGSDKLDGVLDDVRFYDRAISAAEVRVIYEEGLASTSKYVPRLLVNYDFDEVKPEPKLVGHWTLDDRAVGGGGLAARGTVQVRNLGRIDSYNSAVGRYGGANVGKHARMSTNGTASSSLAMDVSSSLFGDAYCGSGGNPATAISAHEGAISGKRLALQVDVPVLDDGAPSAMPASEGDVTCSTDQAWSSDRTFGNLTLSESATVTVDGDVRVHCTGWFRAGGSSRILVTPGSSLLLHAASGVVVGGSAALNPESGAPGALRIVTYGSDTFELNGEATVAAVVRCAAAASVSGSAALHGSLVAGGNVAVRENARVHLDVNLPSVGIDDPPALDHVGANHGFYRGMSTPGQAGAAAHTGTSVALDGKTGFVEIRHHDTYLLRTGAVSLWFRTEDAGREQGLFSKDSAGFDAGGQLTISIVDGRVRARLESTSASHDVWSDAISAGVWHHAVLSFGPHGLRLYLNGVAVAADPYVGGLSMGSGSGNFEPILLGADTASSGDRTVSGWNHPLHGMVDDVRIYDDALDADQVMALASGADLPPSTLAGSVVHDTGDHGAALNLLVPDTTKVQWVDGGLMLSEPVALVSEHAATKLRAAMASSDQMTVVAVIRPADGSQSLATVAACSAGAASVNFAMRQDGATLCQHLRTSSTGTDGAPAIQSEDLLSADVPVSLIASYDGENARLYLNGQLLDEAPRTGNLDNWSDAFRLAVGNQVTGDQPWLGTLDRIAVYDRAFNPLQAYRVHQGLGPGDGVPASYDFRWVE